MRDIYVFGSLNMDLVIQSPYLPEAGETLTGSGFLVNPGGKGANQAAACGKLGGRVHMAGCVGDDAFGQQMKENLSRYGVDTGCVRSVEHVSSGIAVILLINGDNRIILDQGANAFVCVEDAERLLKNALPGDVLLVQLETPIPIVKEAMRIAREKGCITILNPAPLKEGVEALFPYTDMIAPNETEFAALTGTDILGKGSRMLMSAGIREVIVTRGSKGYCYISDGKLVTEDCIKAPVVDTTGAGDTFLGAMAVKLADGEHIESALRFANRAAAVTVQRRGAQVAIPTLLEVEESFRAQRQRA